MPDGSPGPRPEREETPKSSGSESSTDDAGVDAGEEEEEAGENEDDGLGEEKAEAAPLETAETGAMEKAAAGFVRLRPVMTGSKAEKNPNPQSATATTQAKIIRRRFRVR